MTVNSSSQVRVRFAPSPTGHLHIGSFRTALFNWLFARHNNGKFLLRIEDTDLERSKPEYVKSITEALDWVELYPDEPTVVQSQRIAEHKKVLQQLLAQDKAYKCFCTQDEIVVRAGDNAFISYDKKCRTADQNVQKPYVVRFKLPDIREVTFDDLIRGTITIPADQLDDFIIARSDGSPMYNFVVVVDDHDMAITHVIRGEDHISNTPKQILLYQACGYQVPHFAHIPLILGPSGDRLSKRDGATSALAYKQMGYLPNALMNYLVRLGWSHGNQEIFTREELVSLFTLKAVGKKGSIFDIEKLNWMNGVYIRESATSHLLSYIEKELDASFAVSLHGWDAERICKAIALYQERAHTLLEVMDGVTVLHGGPEQYVQADLDKWITPETSDYLVRLIDLFQSYPNASADELQSVVKALAKELNIKFAQLAQPMRIALIGSSSGPGVFDMLAVVGAQSAMARLSRLRDFVS